MKDDAATLGGQTRQSGQGNLRSYRKERFSGRSSFYVNSELRIKLFDFETYFFPIKIGALGFYDNGRVWVDDEKSTKWHQGYGGGLWISPLEAAVVTITYAASPEADLIAVNMGFLF